MEEGKTVEPLKASWASSSMNNTTGDDLLRDGHTQIFLYILLLLISYPILVSVLRFRRINRLRSKYKYFTRESLAQMTDNEAWEIQQVMAQLEFPFFFVTAVQFALFRTYGIPTISHLLTRTGEFSKPQTSLKRYADTALLISEFMSQPPTSKRAYASLARTRYVHSGYRATGKILENDMLYTLGLFAIQPIRFIEKYEWRKVTDLERCALGTYWKSVGDSLRISYDVLPSGKKGFQDGIHWLEEITVWSDDYEARHMAPDPANRETADQTTPVIVYMVPKLLQPIGLKFVSFMMDDRLQKAMMYDPPPKPYAKVFSSLLSIRKFALKYLALPRPYFLRNTVISEDLDENNRGFMTKWDAAPYYVKPSLWNRWGPFAWLTWALGKPLPGDEGDKYHPQGFYTPHVGPNYYAGKGQQYLEITMEDFKTSRTGRCPFH